MKLAHVARMLGINDRTLKLWIERPELAPHFSRPARLPAAQRDLNDDDLIVANTIRAMRVGVSNLEVDWQQMGERLASGYRENELPASAVTVDNRMPVLRQYERTVTLAAEHNTALKRAQELEAQLIEQAEQYKAEVQQLRAEMATLHQERRGDIERLSQKITDAEARAVAYEAELKLWQAGRLRAE